MKHNLRRNIQCRKNFVRVVWQFLTQMVDASGLLRMQFWWLREQFTTWVLRILQVLNSDSGPERMIAPSALLSSNAISEDDMYHSMGSSATALFYNTHVLSLNGLSTYKHTNTLTKCLGLQLVKRTTETHVFSQRAAPTSTLSFKPLNLFILMTHVITTILTIASR